MTDETNSFSVDLTASPAPLGLSGLRDDHSAAQPTQRRYLRPWSMILAMGIFYGGLAQVIAGMMEWKKGNTFGATSSTEE